MKSRIKKRHDVKNYTTYKELAELLPETVFEAKLDGTIIFANDNGLKMFGYVPNDFQKGLNLVQMIIPAEREQAVLKLKGSYSEGKTVSCEYTALRKDGTTFPVLINYTPIVKNGRVTGFRGFVIDISHRKKIEAELAESENKFRKIAEKSLAGIYIIQDNKFIYINSRFAEILGYDVDEITGKLSPADLTVPADRQIVNNNISKRINSEVDSINYQFRGLTKQKKIIDVEVLGSSTMFRGKPAIIGSIFDITERKKSENELKKLSRAVEQSPVSIIITDVFGSIEYVNSKFCEVTGYSFDEVIGKRPSILKSGEQDEAFYNNLWTTLTNGNEWRGELHNKKKNGELFWELASISPIKNSSGIITNYLAVKEDITARKIIETELTAAKEKAEETNRLKSSFLANMSHELRTPLIGILGFAEILSEELKDLEQKEMANTILISGQRLLNSLNMILDLSRIEAEKLQFDFQPVNLSSAVQDAVSIFATSAKNKKLDFSLLIKDSETVSRVDERVFKQIIKNLLNNAIKFTTNGGIAIEVFSEITSDSIFNVVKISDTGIGIEKKDQQLIFEEFRQVSEGFNRPYEGTGIGLTLAKKFVELMDGRIFLNSERGSGSTFTIKFPSLKKITGTKRKSLDSIPISIGNPKILSVENDPSSVKIIRYFLKDLCDIEHAEDAENALKLVKKNNYKAILMDINLGAGMDGLEAVKEIKKFPHCKDLPVVAITSYAYPSDREKFLKNGCTHYIAKPFERKKFVDLISEILKN